MAPARVVIWTFFVMLAFAGNSLLCRMALKQSAIDPASFTSIRLTAGALALWLIVHAGRRAEGASGNWLSSFVLFIYAAALSFAYGGLSAATGALILFGAVQITMIGYGVYRGERFQKKQFVGLILALGGLIGLMLPGIAAPPLNSSLLMFCSGAAWGVYSLRGAGGGSPTQVTAGNFLRAVPMSMLMSLLLLQYFSWDYLGVLCAVTSGALTSAVGYAIWYAVLPELSASQAATVQLSAPVITAIGGVILLAEPLSLHLVVSSVTILGGIVLVITGRKKNANER